MSDYRAEDLADFDAFSHARKSWKMFLHVDGIDSAKALLERLADDPRRLGATDVRTYTSGRWFVVHSNLDWVPDTIVAGKHLPNSAFGNVVPYVKGNNNSFHYITYISAWATQLVSISPKCRHVISGSVDSDHSIWQLSVPTGTQRTIAYTIDEVKYWGG